MKTCLVTSFFDRLFADFALYVVFCCLFTIHNIQFVFIQRESEKKNKETQQPQQQQQQQQKKCFLLNKFEHMFGFR